MYSRDLDEEGANSATQYDCGSRSHLLPQPAHIFFDGAASRTDIYKILGADEGT